MTEKGKELIQFLEKHNDLRVWEALADMIQRMLSGESDESIAASYGVSLEGIEE